ncbi:MAG: hypothetical protein PHI96_04420, partial [Desulfovibrio sp.]|nr:hypothetical protein [Desulfovibrio sp.]
LQAEKIDNNKSPLKKQSWYGEKVGQQLKIEDAGQTAMKESKGARQRSVETYPALKDLAQKNCLGSGDFPQQIE